MKPLLIARTRSEGGMPDERARISACYDPQKTNHVILHLYSTSGNESFKVRVRYTSAQPSNLSIVAWVSQEVHAAGHEL